MHSQQLIETFFVQLVGWSIWQWPILFFILERP
jgi:hypothetical protein